jgi:hypothetical protein
MRAKMNRYGTFLTLLDRFKNHIFYERKRMKKLALFLTDVKKNLFFFKSSRKVTLTDFLPFQRILQVLVKNQLITLKI